MHRYCERCDLFFHNGQHHKELVVALLIDSAYHYIMTHTEILKQPNGKVSRLLTLLKLDDLRSSAQNKADVLDETAGDLERLYKRWFQELADHTDRIIDELNQSSEDTE